MPTTDRWEIRWAKPGLERTLLLVGSVDPVLVEAVLRVQEEIAYHTAEHNDPLATPAEIEDAVYHVRHKTLSDPDVDARVSERFFFFRIDMGSYSIIASGFRK